MMDDLLFDVSEISAFNDFLDSVDLDNDFKISENMDVVCTSSDTSGNSSDSYSSDFCMSFSTSPSRSSKFHAQDFFCQEQKQSPKAKSEEKVQKKIKPRRTRQNISRRPGETDAQLKERRYQAKLKRNRESGMRARKRRKNAFGSLKLEQEQLLQQVRAKELILGRLEQQNAQLKQALISERAANHPLFSISGPGVRGRRSQEQQAPPLTIFAVAFVALLTWSATLESSSFYGRSYHSTKPHPHAKVFQAGTPASLGTPAAVMALECILQYTLQVQQNYWHIWKAFVQLMIIFILSMCFLGLFPSMIGSGPTTARARCRRLRSSTNRSTRVSFTSSSSTRAGVRSIQHTHHRRVITYII